MQQRPTIYSIPLILPPVRHSSHALLCFGRWIVHLPFSHTLISHPNLPRSFSYPPSVVLHPLTNYYREPLLNTLTSFASTGAYGKLSYQNPTNNAPLGSMSRDSSTNFSSHASHKKHSRSVSIVADVTSPSPANTITSAVTSGTASAASAPTAAISSAATELAIPARGYSYRGGVEPTSGGPSTHRTNEPLTHRSVQYTHRDALTHRDTHRSEITAPMPSEEAPLGPVLQVASYGNKMVLQPHLSSTFRRVSAPTTRRFAHITMFAPQNKMTRFPYDHRQHYFLILTPCFQLPTT